MKKAFFITLTLLVITIAMLFFLNKGDIKSAKSSGIDILISESSDEKEDKVHHKGIHKINGEAREGALGYLKITFLDIGQGDASFIEWPDGTQMLVDCSKDARVLEALGRVMKYYDKKIDYLLVTHPDLDHYGGCTDVLKRFDVENIIYTGLDKKNEQWDFFWQTVQDEGSEYKKIDKEQEWEIDGSTIHFLYPDHDVSKGAGVPGSNKKSNGNDSSIIFKLSYGDSDVLFMGDAEEELESYLVDSYGEELDVEILKIGHHGSGTSSGEDFLDSVTPDDSIISVGKNSYGHPSRRVIKRLDREDSGVWRTDLHGDIVLHLDLKSEKGYTLENKY